MKISRVAEGRTFEPGPRWFVALTSFEDPARPAELRAMEGHSDEGEGLAAAAMIEVGAMAIYAFVRPVDLREISAVLRGGKSLLEAFADDIDLLYVNEAIL